jgi:MFS family permease
MEPTPLRYQAINSIIGLIGELLLMMVVDKIGRRKLVVGGNLAMCLTYVISTIFLAQFPPEVNNTGAHWGFIIMTWVYNFCFASMGSLCMSSLNFPFPPSLDQVTETTTNA